MKASEKERELREFQAKTEQQAELTKSAIDIEIQENLGKAELQKAEQDSVKIKRIADAKAYEVEKLAHAESESKKHLANAAAYETSKLADAAAYEISKLAEAESESIEKIGVSQAMSIEKQVESYGGVMYMLQKEAIEKMSAAIKEGKIALVPQNLVSLGSGNDVNAIDTLKSLTGMMVAEKIGIDFKEEVNK